MRKGPVLSRSPAPQSQFTAATPADAALLPRSSLPLSLSLCLYVRVRCILPISIRSILRCSTHNTGFRSFFKQSYLHHHHPIPFDTSSARSLSIQSILAISSHLKLANQSINRSHPASTIIEIKLTSNPPIANGWTLPPGRPTRNLAVCSVITPFVTIYPLQKMQGQ